MLSIVYRRTIAFADSYVPPKLRPLWEHPAGPKTIFFWAPLAKWGLVLAGIGDVTRPAELISVPQSASLGLTGLIWSRWSLVIIPKNWGLFGCNIFVAVVNSYSLARGIKYQMALKEKETKTTNS